MGYKIRVAGMPGKIQIMYSPSFVLEFKLYVNYLVSFSSEISGKIK